MWYLSQRSCLDSCKPSEDQLALDRFTVHTPEGADNRRNSDIGGATSELCTLVRLTG